MNSLEEKALSAFLVGEDEILAALREQLAHARLTAQDWTGSGFITQLMVPTEIPKAPLQGRQIIGDVYADIAGMPTGAGFLLSVDDGYLDYLEGFSPENWDPDAAVERMYYVHRDVYDEHLVEVSRRDLDFACPWRKRFDDRAVQHADEGGRAATATWCLRGTLDGRMGPPLIRGDVGRTRGMQELPTQRAQLEQGLAHHGWVVAERGGTTHDRWVVEEWTVQSTWSPRTLTLRFQFESDPMGGYGPGPLKVYDPATRQDVPVATVFLKPRWERNLAAFLGQLNAYRDSVARGRPHHPHKRWRPSNRG